MCFGVGDNQMGLQTGEPFASLFKFTGGTAQLVGGGPVFGIKNHNQRAAGLTEPVIEGARFGARLAFGHHDQTEALRQCMGQQSMAGQCIIGFQQKQDFESVGGIVECPEFFQQLADNFGLPIERHQHRVDGKTVFIRFHCAILLGQRNRQHAETEHQHRQDHQG